MLVTMLQCYNVTMLHIKVEVTDLHQVTSPCQFIQLVDFHHRDGDVVLSVLTELVGEVTGGADTLGFTATEPIVPGQ